MINPNLSAIVLIRLNKLLSFKSHCQTMSQVLLFAYATKLNIWAERHKLFMQKNLHCDFKWFSRIQSSHKFFSGYDTNARNLYTLPICWMHNTINEINLQFWNACPITVHHFRRFVTHRFFLKSWVYSWKFSKYPAR